jgi:LacI family transcriptional regulator
MTVDSTSAPPARILLMDVARLAGVSRTTASFVLSGRADMGISTAAADRVRQAARVLGYRPSLAAAVLHDKMIFVGETGGDPQVEARLINNMLDRGAGAFVYASQRLLRVRLSTVLQAQRVVLVNCMTRPSDIPTVIPDERGAGRSAAEALIACGHRDGILVVGRAGLGGAASLRVRGINDVLGKHGARTAATVLTYRRSRWLRP